LNSEVVFFTRNHLTIWIQWIVVVKLHHPKTWNKNLIKLVRSGRSSDNIFSSVLRLVISFFHSPTLMIWSCFFLFIFSTIHHFPFSTFRWVKSHLHPPHVPVLKALFYATAFTNLYFHPSLFPNHQIIHRHSFIIILSRLGTFFAQGMSNSCIGFSLEDKKKIGCLGKKALETRDIKRNALVLVSAIYFPHWISVSLYLCWFH